jgi:hypothetical protein
MLAIARQPYSKDERAKRNNAGKNVLGVKAGNACFLLIRHALLA